MTVKLDKHHACILWAVSLSLEWQTSEQIYRAAYGRAFLPGVQATATRLGGLARQGLLERRQGYGSNGLARQYLINTAGRLALADHRDREEAAA